MKAFVLLAFILSSFSSWAKCPNIKDSDLSSDQLIVKNLLQSAYKYQAEGIANENITEFTTQMKRDFVQASEFLDEGEISSFLTEQDAENNICPNNSFVSSAALTDIISGRIYDTYYGCGCEH